MDQELQQNLLDQMHDIHLPAEVSWWPLAIGWWIVIFLFLAAAIFAIWALIQNRNKNRYRSLSIAKLDAAYSQWREDADAARFVQATNAILKRALATGTSAPSLSLSGQYWIDLLNQYGKTPLSEDSARALASAGYEPNPNIDIDKLHAETSNWIRTHRSKPIVQEYSQRKTAHA